MKVIAVLEADVASGGGYHQALNAVLQLQDVCRDRFALEVLTTRRSNVDVLRRLHVATEPFSLSLLDRLLLRLSLYDWWHPVQAKLRLVGPMEKKLLARGCDLVYFVAPSILANLLQRLPFITTVWDLCHRDAPEFPEVREFAEFRVREHAYRSILPPALAVITDSAELADAVARRYGVDRDRLLPVPFAPAPQLLDGSSTEKNTVLAKHGLKSGYFFYPAQFWAHKNHIRVLQALLMLRARGRTERVAFAGGDQGALAYVRRFADVNGLGEQVRFLGFVPAEDMRGLYEGACAVVMPTYFGPTNLPPLEAWATHRPLIYSAHFRAQVGEAAICVDPDSAEELAQAMLACNEEAVCDDLIRKGSQRLREIEQQRAAAQAELTRRLLQFQRRRECWT